MHVTLLWLSYGVVCMGCYLFIGRTAYQVSYSIWFVCELKLSVVLQEEEAGCQQPICRLFTSFCEPTANIFHSNSRARHTISLIEQKCTYPHCTGSGSSSFAEQHHMSRCCAQIEGPGTCKATVVCEAQVGSAVQQQSIQSALLITSHIMQCRIDRVIQNEVTHCTLLLIGQFSSQR